MTACCCRLTQPAKRKTTNTNGAGSESMAQACPRGGPSARRAEIRDRRYPVGPSSRTQASCDSRNAPIVEQSGLGGVFAQHAGSRRRPATSGRRGRLVERTMVRLPAIQPDTGLGTARLRVGFRRTPLQSRMGAMTVMVPLELEELQLQVGGRPEEQPVQAFAPNRADQAFDEGMRERHVRQRRDLVHVED